MLQNMTGRFLDRPLVEPILQHPQLLRVKPAEILTLTVAKRFCFSYHHKLER